MTIKSTVKAAPKAAVKKAAAKKAPAKKVVKQETAAEEQQPVHQILATSKCRTLSDKIRADLQHRPR